MQLKIVSRKGAHKGEVKALRRSGWIPANLYVKGQAGVSIALSATEFATHMRSMVAGHLPTTVFTLVDEHGRERKVLIKEIQYAVTTYDVLHLDFEELVDGQMVNVKVPIECVGVAESSGVKLGGALRQVLRHVPVRCPVNALPKVFELDVKDLEIGGAKRLSDLQWPKEVRPLVNLREVAAAIVKK